MKSKIDEMEQELESKMKEIQILKEKDDIVPVDFHITVEALEDNFEIKEALKVEEEKLLNTQKELQEANEYKQKIYDELQVANKNKNELETELLNVNKSKEEEANKAHNTIRKLTIRCETAEESENDASIKYNQLTSDIYDYERKLTDLNNTINDLNKTVQDKDNHITDITNTNTELESNCAQFTSIREKLDNDIINKDAELRELNERLKQEKTTQEEMYGEIQILIKQYKNMQIALKLREDQLLKQKEEIEQTIISLEETSQGHQKQEAYISRLVQQLESKKNQLHSAQLRIKEMSKSLAVDTDRKLVDRNKEIEIMKEMARLNKSQLNSKNDEIGRLKKKVNKLLRMKDIQSQFITTFSNKDNKDQIEELKKVENLVGEDISDEEELEPDDGLVNSSIFPEIGKKKVSKKTNVPIELRKNYMKQYNNYLKQLEEKGIHNNSSNIRNLLAQDRGMEYYNLNNSVSPERDIDKNDVNSIIKRSIIEKSAHTSRPQKKKVMNIKVGNDPFISAVASPSLRLPNYNLK